MSEVHAVLRQRSHILLLLVLVIKSSPRPPNNYATELMEQYTLCPLSKNPLLSHQRLHHKSIHLCPFEVKILNTSDVQHICKLKQCGMSEHTYMNANHTWLEH